VPDRPIPIDGGGQVTPQMLLVDSGGPRWSEVYQFSQSDPRIHPAKGEPGRTWMVTERPQKRHGVVLWKIDTEQSKDLLHRLIHDPDKTKWLPHSRSTTTTAGRCAASRRSSTRRERREEWVEIVKNNNHLWDCEHMQCAAAWRMGCGMRRAAELLQGRRPHAHERTVAAGAGVPLRHTGRAAAASPTRGAAPIRRTTTTRSRGRWSDRDGQRHRRRAELPADDGQQGMEPRGQGPLLPVARKCSVRGPDIDTGCELQRMLWSRSRVAGDIGWILVKRDYAAPIIDSRIQVVPAENIVTPDGMYADPASTTASGSTSGASRSTFYVLNQDERGGKRKFTRSRATSSTCRT
jgi:hypothetical protein